MFKDTKEGQTNYCVRCEEEARCRNETSTPHTCKTNTLDKCPCEEVRHTNDEDCKLGLHNMCEEYSHCEKHRGIKGFINCEDCKLTITPLSDNKVKPEGVGEWEYLAIKYGVPMGDMEDLLLQEKAKCMADFEKRLEEYRNSPDVWKNVGVSKWRNWGDQNGYFEFFKAKWKGEVRENIGGEITGGSYEKGLEDMRRKVLTLIDKL